jgi:superfamily II DNA or RNA helicase
LTDAESSQKLGLYRVDLRAEYNTEDDDIIKDLYGPCLSVSKRYDRAVGYFRANIYKELGENLLNFIIAGGKVRIVCSPDLPEQDEEAAREGYCLRGHRSPQEVDSNLAELLEEMSRNPKELDCLEMLCLLIESGSLDLYIAVKSGGIYHRKIGVFYDQYVNMVVFSGSGNETRQAINSIEDWGNDEEFDIYRSWGSDFESGKALKKAAYINRLFNGGTRSTRVRPLNDIERNILAKFRSYHNLEECRSGARMRDEALTKKGQDNDISLYYYQHQAIKCWESAGRVGMLSMATGTGKTITALFAISQLVKEGRPILILVPSRLLLNQWKEAVIRFYPNVPLLLAGGGHKWKANAAKRLFVSNYIQPRIILSTMNTASTKDFIEYFSQAENPVLVADEAHHLGSPINRAILKLNFKEKLGLSATPERLFDLEGDNALKVAFGEIPVYCLPLSGKVKLSEGDIKDVPIIGHFLSRYEYDFDVVHLTEEEQNHWNKVTSEIHKTIVYGSANKRNEEIKPLKDSKLMNLFIKRARIQKHSIEKINCACRIIANRYPPHGRWIIYCDDERQMTSVANLLREKIKHVPILVYHSKMSQDNRNSTLSYLQNKPSIVVSIRCLDEGVDIPAVDGALILASSTNPREYIQRRGRVLRKAKDKNKSLIIDTIVLPNSNSDSDNLLPMVRSELARAWEFANVAENKDVLHRLWKLCMDFGVNIGSDARLSIYDETED